jgi:branched-chain amino acid transport system ATP-binding protein
MNPQLLAMDEPSGSLAPIFIQEEGNVIKRVPQEGMSVLLIEQNLGLALSSADRCYIGSKGRTVHAATAHDLRHDKKMTKR